MPHQSFFLINIESIMKNKNSINKIVILNIISTLILQGLTFFTSPIISRMLGPSNYGIASVYITWVALFSTVFGLQTQSTIAIAEKDIAEEKQLQYQSSILALSLVAYILFSIVVLLFADEITGFMGFKQSIIYLVLLQGFGQYVVTFVNVKLTYEFKAFHNFILTIIVAFSTLGLSLILISIFPSDINYMGRILGQLIPYTILGLGLCIYLFIKGRLFYNKNYWKYCIPLCIPIVFHNLSNLVLNQSDRVMIQAMTGSYSAGIYSLAYSFGSVISTVWASLNNSWVPFYYEYSRKNEFDVMRFRAKNYTELFTVLAVGFNLVYTEVYHWFAGKDYWQGTYLISIFTFGFYCMFLYSFPVNYEFFYKKTKIIAIGTITAAICNILLNCVLITQFGIYGAAVATALSYLLQFIFHYIFASKIVCKGDKQYPFHIKMFLPYIVMFISFIVVSVFLESFTFVRWGIGLLIGFVELIRIVMRKSIF